MTLDSVIAGVALEFKDFALDDVDDDVPDPYANHCEYAQVFGQWATDMLREHVHREPNAVSIANAKVLLLDRYFEWRVSVPKSHRNRIAGNGHICIFHVLERGYKQIRMAELRLTKPFVVTTAPPQPSRPMIAGITLGEMLGDA